MEEKLVKKVIRKQSLVLVLICSFILNIYIIYFGFKYFEKKNIEEKNNKICSRVNSETNPKIRQMIREACINNKIE
jgi:hypothetical protein